MAAVRRHPADLSGHEARVPDRGEGERDHPPRVGAAPLVDVPVVVRPQHGEGQVLVLRAGEVLAAELGVGREVHRREHAVDVHVTDALVDVPAARADLAEPGRLDAVLVRRPASHRVQADVRRLLPLEHPRVGAILPRDDLGCLVGVLGRNVPGEHVRRLDDVVVDRHKDQIVNIHRVLPVSERASCESRSWTY